MIDAVLATTNISRDDIQDDPFTYDGTLLGPVPKTYIFT